MTGPARVAILALAGLSVAAAGFMIITMSMYRAGLTLMVSFLALAGLFFLLDAELLFWVYAATLSTYTRMAVMVPDAARAPAFSVTGEETLLPLAGEQICAPAADGTQGLEPPPPVLTVKYSVVFSAVPLLLYSTMAK